MYVICMSKYKCARECVCVCACACHGIHVEVKEQLCRLHFFLPPLNPGDQTEVIRIVGNYLYPLSYLIGPTHLKHLFVYTGSPYVDQAGSYSKIYLTVPPECWD